MLTLLWLSCLIILVVSVIKVSTVKVSVIEVSVVEVSVRFVIEATFVVFLLSAIALSIFHIALCV